MTTNPTTDLLRQAIPVTDPQAALLFCQALAEFLQKSPRQPSLVPEQRVEMSVIVPACNEQDNLAELYDRLVRVLSGLTASFEILFVDDGSTDDSLSILHGLQAKDQRVVVIELARNFGHQMALCAGLQHAHGQAVVIIDGDLQDPPEAIPDLVSKWKAGYQVVYAVRTNRKESLLLRASYAAFYKMLAVIADIKIPLDAGDFCIMDRCVVDSIIGMPEHHRFLRGIRSWVGFKQLGVPVERQPRLNGKPKYSFLRLLSLALDGFVSFSVKPLRLISIFGIGVSLASLLIAVAYFIQKVTVGLSPPGFATLVVLMSLLAGVQLITIGLIGEYLGRVLDEARRRPLYIVRNIKRS